MVLTMQYMYTPLHYAAEANSIEILSLLLDAGADINAKTEVSLRLTDRTTTLTMYQQHIHVER